MWEWRIESYREQSDKITAVIAGQEATLREIEQQTWGVGYREAENGRRWLLLPGGSRAYLSNSEGFVAELPRK